MMKELTDQTTKRDSVSIGVVQSSQCNQLRFEVQPMEEIGDVSAVWVALAMQHGEHPVVELASMVYLSHLGEELIERPALCDPPFVKLIDGEISHRRTLP